MMIDTHAHLDFPQFDTDRNEVISTCKKNGVQFIINIGVDLKSSLAGIKLAEKYDFIYATVGFHPHDAKNLTDSAFDQLKKLAVHPKVVGIGEIGLDFYRNLSPVKLQEKAFIKQLDLAEKLNLPVVLHIRKALDQVYEILHQRGKNRGILHAFPGDKSYAAEGVDMGYYIAFGGPITYPNSRGPAVAGSVPISRILTETDCPYLPPQKYRGKRNQPDYVKYVIEKLVDVFPKCLFEDIRRITSKNAGWVFNIPVDDSPMIVYKIGTSLYINLTGRCTNNCYFCPKNHGFHVAGHNLKLNREPDEKEILQKISELNNYNEIVFCGLGEPTLRADLMLSLAKKLKEKKVPLRLNTNGQGNLINKTDLTKKMAGLIDVVNVSLNAHDEKTYNDMCRPQFTEKVYDKVIDFGRRCKQMGINTIFSVVDMPKINTEACKKIADNIGIPLRVRKYVP
jgi:TatD DNase family protein